MKIKDYIDRDVYVDDSKIGEVKDIQIDPIEWKVTHLEVQLKKEITKTLFGARTSFRNMLAISALKDGNDCCSERGIEVKVSMGQLQMYLRPTEK
jgi:sporulation protein YlmC with PRC-barrel domain